jgi:hypothetical protein
MNCNVHTPIFTEVDCTADNGYIIFTAPHFLPYALYYTAAEETTTTAAATTTSKTVSSGKKANGGSGTYDNTPATGVKDFMWIAVPVAVMLTGVGIVVLAMRKRKSLDK